MTLHSSHWYDTQSIIDICCWKSSSSPPPPKYFWLKIEYTMVFSIIFDLFENASSTRSNDRTEHLLKNYISTRANDQFPNVYDFRIKIYLIRLCYVGHGMRSSSVWIVNLNKICIWLASICWLVWWNKLKGRAHTHTHIESTQIRKTFQNKAYQVIIIANIFIYFYQPLECLTFDAWCWCFGASSIVTFNSIFEIQMKIEFHIFHSGGIFFNCTVYTVWTLNRTLNTFKVDLHHCSLRMKC